MSFTRALERNFNRDMKRGRAGTAPRDRETEDTDIKKPHGGPAAYVDDDEEEDAEMSEKKDRPPRFSRVFGGVAPAPNMEEQDLPRRRRASGGILIPLPLFIVLAIFFFLETTFLFTYTIIGLYNNRPTGLLPFGSTSSPVGSCNCADRQAGINIAPNFVLPQQTQATVTIIQTTTNAGRPDLVPLPVPTTFTKSISANTISTSASITEGGQSAATSAAPKTSAAADPGKAAGAAISKVKSLLGSAESEAKTTSKATLAKKTTPAKTTTSTHSSASYSVGLCFNGSPSSECADSREIIPEEGDE